MSELTKAALAADEAVIARHVPDRSLDPPEGDATDDEIWERRREALFNVTDDELVDMLCDEPMLGPVLYTAIVAPMRDDREPETSDRQYLADRIVEIMTPRIERWLEVNE